jgi:hypothetical protein
MQLHAPVKINALALIQRRTIPLPAIGVDIGRRRAKHPKSVNPRAQKYSTFPNFGFVAYARHPGPARGAFRDRHEMRAGVRWTR